MTTTPPDALALAERLGLTALDVACPRCGAKPEYGCFSRGIRGTFGAKTHMARFKAAGIEHPTDADRENAYRALKRFQSAHISQAYADMRARGLK